MTVYRGRVAPTRLFNALVVLISTATSQAQGQNATCKYNETDGWSNLGESGKDVCSIARELMLNTCGLPHIPSLDVNLHSNLGSMWYTASRFEHEKVLTAGWECACERVMYNLLSACAGCQKWQWSQATNKSIEWQSFQTYEDGSCPPTNKTLAKRITWSPEPPAWATDPNMKTFDPNGVQLSSATTNPTNVSSPSTAVPVAETPLATGDAAQLASSPSSGPPTGAIVGGVIGGLIFLGVIAGLAFWLHCRKRRARDVAPSSEFLKPEYYATPPLLPAHERRNSAYRDEMEEDTGPSPTRRHSWATGLMTTRRHEEDDDDCEMLPPFTRGAYIGPSPHEKGYPERRDTGDTDITLRTNDTTTFLLSLSSPTRPPGASGHFA